MRGLGVDYIIYNTSPGTISFYPSIYLSIYLTNLYLCFCLSIYLSIYLSIQGYNGRKVISEVCASLVLQCTVSGRECKHKTDVEAWHGIHLSHQWNILVIGNYCVNYQNYKNLMLLTSLDTKRTLMHLFLFTNSAQRELVSIFTQSIRNCN